MCRLIWRVFHFLRIILSNLPHCCVLFTLGADYCSAWDWRDSGLVLILITSLCVIHKATSEADNSQIFRIPGIWLRDSVTVSLWGWCLPSSSAAACASLLACTLSNHFSLWHFLSLLHILSRILNCSDPYKLKCKECLGQVELIQQENPQSDALSFKIRC